MPKIVDHDARRAQIADAVFALVDRSGTAGVTVRALAAETGWSMGAVRYYFASQTQLMLFAAEEMARRVEERVRAILAAEPPSMARAEHLLAAMLPLDAERASEVRVWAAFMSAARVDAGYERVRLASWQGERLLARIAVADVVGRGWPTADGLLADPALEPVAERLHVLIDGLSLHGISNPNVDAAEQRRQLRGWLQEIASSPDGESSMPSSVPSPLDRRQGWSG